MTRWLARVGWLSVPVALAFLAIPRLSSGMMTDASFPVPTYIRMNYPLPRAAYRQAADILDRADSNDGEAMIARAEAMSLSGTRPRDVISVLHLGLSDSPASPRGWTLLAEQEGMLDHRRAAAPLALAINLGRYDFWLAGRRGDDAVILWDALDADGESAALDQLRLLWHEPLLRGEIEPLLALDRGPALMTRALAGEPYAVRELNRWLGEQRRKALLRR